MSPFIEIIGNCWILVIFISFYLVICEFTRPKKYPPGPQWYPIVGNSLEVKNLSIKHKGLHKATKYLADLYDTKVLGLKLGRDQVVVVFSEPYIRKVLTGDTFQARPDTFFLRLRTMGTKRGITMVDGPLWEEHRIFAVRHLREMGLGKTLMEDMILDELNNFMQAIGNGEELSWPELLSPSILNVLWFLVAGSSFKKGDPKLQRILDLMQKRSVAFDMAGGVLNQFPWLRYIAPDRSGFNLINQLNSEIYHFLMESLEEHRKTLIDDISRDFIDAFLHEMSKKDGPSTFTDDQLIAVCLDFLIAGSVTSSSSLDFALLHALLVPGVQEKLQNEIDGVLKDGQLPSVSNRSMMPYVEAFLLESQRMKNVAPLIGPRRVTKESELNGYIIPEGTTVFLNLYDFHYDKERWGDPDVFRPERFIDSDGKFAPEQLYIFSYGKRRCFGETLARNFIFLFFVGIIKNFSLNLAPGRPTPTLDPNFGITLSSKPYTMLVDRRFKSIF